MDGFASLFLASVGVLALIGLGTFGVISVREGEHRAARVSFTLSVPVSALFFGAAVMPSPVPIAVAVSLAVVCLAAIILWFARLAGDVPLGGRPTRKVDERDIMFSRGRLVPGSVEYESYYRMRPQNRMGDDHTRSLPGLLSLDAQLAEPLSFAAAEASFDLTDAVRHHVDGEIAEQRSERPAEQWTVVLKDLARSYGAVDVGVTELLPYHVYSNVGRGTGAYGEAVDLDHRWALAFSVEMDHRRISKAPAAPVVEESARQYVEGAKIALILASWIRRLGYPARAHIDGNYRVIAPLVARDAGLGEIGRMGILMTPRLGPRVRLGVVTTDLPLIADQPGDDVSVIDFCTFCRKCAVNCPVAAIPFDQRIPVDDGLRWAIDAETCFRYWNVVGTDCATCVRVCPYSHPDNLAHNMVRWAITRSASARRVMLWLDDLFYGKRLPSIGTME